LSSILFLFLLLPAHLNNKAQFIAGCAVGGVLGDGHHYRIGACANLLALAAQGQFPVCGIGLGGGKLYCSHTAQEAGASLAVGVVKLDAAGLGIRVYSFKVDLEVFCLVGYGY